ncbi:histidine phosphatase family protein [Gordonia sp. VNK21]|uniref:histidine phosphatase family protein n=1 Tax=Gordonia sp. VNK21 TaxID=3382483 RepID=UPI0038D38908
MGGIYLVRHGQAPATAYGVGDAAAAGPGLTELGTAQARRTGAELAGLVPGFTAAISGDLPRQRATLAGVLEAFQTPPEPVVDPDWNEYEIPQSIDASAEELTRMYRDGAAYQRVLDAALARWVGGEDSGGESYAAFGGRVAAAAERAVALAGSGQNVLVVSSAGVIMQLVARLWQVPDAQWPTLARSMFNASFSRLLVGRSGVTVVSVNEHAHLAAGDAGLASFR